MNMNITLIRLTCFTCFLCIAASARAVSVGDDRAAVDAELGKPAGRFQVGKLEVLSYDRGEVELEQGVVTRVQLISAEAAKAEKLEREAAEKKQREQRIVAGKALKEQTLADPDFRNSSASHRVAFWESFKKNYREVPVDAVSYETARRELAIEQAEQAAREAEARARADLERRVVEAEARTRKAEQEASEAQTPVNYGGVYYPQSRVIVNGSGDRSRQVVIDRDRRPEQLPEVRPRPRPQPLPEVRPLPRPQPLPARK